MGTLFDVAQRDALSALRNWRLWSMLGWNDIRQRYRRSTLGPFWITLSMMVFIGVLGVIYSKIFSINVDTYLPYLTVGYVTWGFISQVLTESCNAFQEGATIIKQLRLPHALFICRTVWRNFIVFLHTIVIYIPVAIFFGIWPGSSALLVLPGLALLLANLFWMALVLGILASRFRDIIQMVTTLIQIMMFATPIMWPVSSLKGETWIAEVNPVYHFIELIRAPLLGTPPALLSWVVSVATVVVGSGAALYLLNRASKRIVFWI